MTAGIEMFDKDTFTDHDLLNRADYFFTGRAGISNATTGKILCTALALKWGVGVCPERNLLLLMPVGCSVYRLHTIWMPKQLNYQPKEWYNADQGWGDLPMSKTTLSKCLVAKNGKQLTSYTFSTMECLLWWAFTPVKVHPLQDFGPYGEWTFAPEWAINPNFTVYWQQSYLITSDENPLAGDGYGTFLHCPV